jgi:GTP cyclohydrolase I
MLPFHGLVHVAYVPGRSGRPLAEGAVQALLKAFSRRLQIQERLTQQLADALFRHSGENLSSPWDWMPG